MFVAGCRTWYDSQGGVHVSFVPLIVSSSAACRRGLNYLLTDPLAKGYRVDGIHLAIALYFTRVGCAGVCCGVLWCAVLQPSKSCVLGLPVSAEGNRAQAATASAVNSASCSLPLLLAR